MPIRARWALATVAVAVAVAVGAAPALAAAEPSLRDARGLEFVSREAFCAYHCRATHVARAYRHLQAASECSVDRCADFQSEHRQLQQTYSFTAVETLVNVSDADVAEAAGFEDKDVTRVDLVACEDERAGQGVSLRVGGDASSGSAFVGFHDAFFAAYDAMLSSTNATANTCHLATLQAALLANATTNANTNDSDSASGSDDTDGVAEPLERRPTLVKLDPSDNEPACLAAIHELWTLEDEAQTPFLTRSDDDDAQAAVTVLLLHVPRTVADRIVDMACILSVTELPAILKLTPFARASMSLARDATATGGPPLAIRLVDDGVAHVVATRLQRAITAATGIANALRVEGSDYEDSAAAASSSSSSHTLLLAAMDDFTAWTQALALVLEDEAVEWVDLHEVIRTGALAPGASFEQRLQAVHASSGLRSLLSLPFLQQEQQQRRRRLDAYVQDLVGVSAVRDKQITGSDIIVGVTDTGLYMYHDQFDQSTHDIYDVAAPMGSARKVVLYRAFGNREDESEQVVCGHGTHVSGILAGSSFSGKETDLGIASSARIAFMDIGKQAGTCAGAQGCPVTLETPGEVQVLMQPQVDAGARIFSFSWGTGGNDYNLQSRDLDNYIYNNPEILIVVAAGNSGDQGPQTISSPSGAKNVISVGASLNAAESFVETPCATVLNQQTVASFSSIGPTLDGRLKPDLVAPGMSIESAQSEAPGSTHASARLCSLQGTSQATPVVAGMAVLLYEWLRDGWWKHGVKNAEFGLKVIPAALLKALLLHSGEKLTRRLVAPRNGVTSCVAMEGAAQRLTAYPDANQGYGKPTLHNLVTFLDDQGAGVYFFPNSTEGSEPSVMDGTQAKFTFMLTERANLRVTLVWTDPAGSMGSKLVLQNDLDLSVRVPDTDIVFFPLSGNGSRDARNNVEMVEVSYEDIVAQLVARGIAYDETTGVLVEAVVAGTSVKAGAKTGQTFALVASSSPASVETNTLSESVSGFWQPWMTAGIVVACTLITLFAIAVGWRFRANGTGSGSGQGNNDGFMAAKPTAPARQYA